VHVQVEVLYSEHPGDALCEGAQRVPGTGADLVASADAVHRQVRRIQLVRTGRQGRQQLRRGQIVRGMCLHGTESRLVELAHARGLRTWWAHAIGGLLQLIGLVESHQRPERQA
jgi:hypothetical protein